MYVVVTNERRLDNVHGAFAAHDEAEQRARKHCVAMLLARRPK
jgi:hypothetical protein